MREELLSIIVPFYNNASYLAQCIDSVINQTYPELELILVDDGSTDDGYQICKQYAELDSRIRLIYKKNEGPILARYTGLMLARAEYIMFIDGDDFIALDMCQVLMSRRLEGEVVTSGLYEYHSANMITCPDSLIQEGIYNKQNLEENIYPCMLWNRTKQCFGLNPSLWGKIFLRKKIVQEFENIKDLRFHYGEDVAIIYPLLLHSDSLVVINTAFYYHRKRTATEVPGYIKDSYYFDKLLVLYKYLRKRFVTAANRSELMIQLDLFYIQSVNMKKRCYQADMEENKYLFPFDKVEKGSRVVLYGAGKVGRTYYQQIVKLNYCALVAWIDKNYDQYTDDEHEISGIEILDKITYDYIIIAIANHCIKQEVIKELTGNNVRIEKII